MEILIVGFRVISTINFFQFLCFLEKWVWSYPITQLTEGPKNWKLAHPIVGLRIQMAEFGTLGYVDLYVLSKSLFLFDGHAQGRSQYFNLGGWKYGGWRGAQPQIFFLTKMIKNDDFEYQNRQVRLTDQKYNQFVDTKIICQFMCLTLYKLKTWTLNGYKKNKK